MKPTPPQVPFFMDYTYIINSKNQAIITLVLLNIFRSVCEDITGTTQNPAKGKGPWILIKSFCFETKAGAMKPETRAEVS
jgi:hypothetical protein